MSKLTLRKDPDCCCKSQEVKFFSVFLDGNILSSNSLENLNNLYTDHKIYEAKALAHNTIRGCGPLQANEIVWETEMKKNWDWKNSRWRKTSSWAGEAHNPSDLRIWLMPGANNW